MASLRELLALSLLAALVGCGEPAEDAAGDDDDPVPLIEGRDCPDEAWVTYESFGSPFLSNWCTGCHSSGLEAPDRQGAPLGMDFDTLAGARAHAVRIYARAGDANATMPPASGPHADERELLGDWLACGMP